MPETEEVAPDGSPVAVYLNLPLEPEFTPFLNALPAPPASVLDLGCGAGRLANRLAESGYRVTGVDESSSMLVRLDPKVERVPAAIEGLSLGHRFDVVVLASHLVNDAEASARRAFLETAAGHLGPEGSVFIQHYDPETIREVSYADHQLGRVLVAFQMLARRGDEFQARVTYSLDGRSWSQEFTAVLLEDLALDRLLAEAGLRRRSKLSPSWLVAERAAGETLTR